MKNNFHDKICLNGEWELSWLRQSETNGKDFSAIDRIKAYDLETVTASVPGNFETDLFKAGVIEDPYFGTNPIKLQELECMHMIYYRTFTLDNAQNTLLTFEGIDCVSDVYVNGKLAGKTDNMFIPFYFGGVDLKDGKNEIVVHIKPAAIAARDYDFSVTDGAMKYNADSLYVRKAPHMYGWDIMPRFLSGGIWRDVYIERVPENRIKDVYLFTTSVNTENKTAHLKAVFNTAITDDSIRDYKIKISGKCGGSEFTAVQDLWHTSGSIGIGINDAKLWWPRNYGSPDLYAVTVELIKNDAVIDTLTFKHGVRVVELDRTSTTDKEGNGEFCFKINHKKVFVLGSNWVPVDAFHSNDINRLPDIMPMLTDIGCNAVRCWGGNVYEHEYFYDWCDENGIMVWQDFAMACARYPQGEKFLQRMKIEVTAVVKRLRHHSSIILWSGDNECDGSGGIKDPNNNLITRKVIPDVLSLTDGARPYLPSSPYMDEEAFRTRAPISEDHLWGPRDYFKGAYYKNTVCHFASETGYHGSPSPESLAKYISADKLWPWQNNEEWLAHAASMELSWNAPYAYRIKLMADQVVTLFGSQPDNLRDFATASQISQAEAKKYFIERFRVSKWRRTGIIWWNLIDGWPQISDAVVDYYYDKKLAYYYIKRSQQPICFIFDEPDADGYLPLYVVNDTQTDKTVRYKVTDLTLNKPLISSETAAKANESRHVWNKLIQPGEKHFYLIEWEYDGVSGKNHYMTNIIDIDYDEYVKYAKTSGFEIQ
jgi:beta-mannosidase